MEPVQFRACSDDGGAATLAVVTAGKVMRPRIVARHRLCAMLASRVLRLTDLRVGVEAVRQDAQYVMCDLVRGLHALQWLGSCDDVAAACGSESRLLESVGRLTSKGCIRKKAGYGAGRVTWVFLS